MSLFLRNKAPGQEIILIQQLLSSIPEVVKENYSLAYFISSVCLRYREYNVNLAQESVLRYFEWRKEMFGSYAPQTLDDELEEHIDSGCLLILPGRTNSGESVIYFRPRLHLSWRFNAKSIYKVLHFLIVMSFKVDAEFYTTSFKILADFDGVTILNADINLPIMMTRIITSLPIRMTSMVLLRPYFFYRYVVPLVDSMYNSELVSLLTAVQENEKVPEALDMSADYIPACVGGRLECDVNALTRAYVKSCTSY